MGSGTRASVAQSSVIAIDDSSEIKCPALTNMGRVEVREGEASSACGFVSLVEEEAGSGPRRVSPSM